MTVTNTDFSNLQLNVKGRTAVVTGGGSGIGLTIVQALLHAGASVTAWDKTLSEPLQQLRQSNPDRLLALEVDVTDEQAIRQAAEKTAARHPVIDIVVNGAGIMYKEEIGKIDPKKWDLIYNIHAKGTMLVTQSLLPHLKQSKCGRIINIASMTARIGIETYMPYSSSKAAVVNMSKVMAAELAPYGITVNAICPGWVNTPMADLLYDRIASVHGIDREQAKKEILDFVPQKRMIPMEEIAFCVLFLASPLAQSISATEFVIDHGLTNNFKPGFHMVHNV